MIVRLSLLAAFLLSLSLVAQEVMDYRSGEQTLEQFQFREELYHQLIENEKKRLENINNLDLRTLHREAHRRRFHLPGEVDWKLIESRNKLSWPETHQEEPIGN